VTATNPTCSLVGQPKNNNRKDEDSHDGGDAPSSQEKMELSEKYLDMIIDGKVDLADPEQVNKLLKQLSTDSGGADGAAAAAATTTAAAATGGEEEEATTGQQQQTHSETLTEAVKAALQDFGDIPSFLMMKIRFHHPR